MTPHPITWMFDLSPVTLTANAMPPRDPNDDDEEDEEDEKDDHQKDEPAVTENPPKTNSLDFPSAPTGEARQRCSPPYLLIVGRVPACRLIGCAACHTHVTSA